jgi:hypothetical protein
MRAHQLRGQFREIWATRVLRMIRFSKTLEPSVRRLALVDKSSGVLHFVISSSCCLRLDCLYPFVQGFMNI